MTGFPSAEMAQYVQMFVDETGEQLDGLVEILLTLEATPTDRSHLNEAFRLIHSIKGSAAIMGLDAISMLSHHLESHFDRLRSGTRVLDQPSMGLVLRCIDFLRECNVRLQRGEPPESAPELIQELNQLAAPSATEHGRSYSEPSDGHATPAVGPAISAPRSEASSRPAPPFTDEGTVRECQIIVSFEPGLPLADLKAQLVLQRLRQLGAVRGVEPREDRLADVNETLRLLVNLESDRPLIAVRQAAGVVGVALVQVEEEWDLLAEIEEDADNVSPTPNKTQRSGPRSVPSARQVDDSPSVRAGGPAAETACVDIDRLDDLPGIVGQLVEFVQRQREAHAHDRDSEMEAATLDEQARLWDECRSGFQRLAEAMEQQLRR